VRRASVLSRRGRPRTHQWGSVLSHTVIPHVELNKAYLALLVAVRARPFRRTSSSGRAPTASKRCATNPRTEQRHNRSSGRASNGTKAWRTGSPESPPVMTQGAVRLGRRAGPDLTRRGPLRPSRFAG